MSLTLLISYCSLLLLASICGFIKYNKMNTASKVLVWYVSATCLFEAAATGAAYYFHNNLLVYHVYSYIQLFLISLYFNLASRKFRKNKLLIIIGVAGIVFGLLDALFIEKPRENENINTHFLVMESFLIIGMSLLSFYELLSSDEFNISRNPRFWFSAIFLVFWSFTFFYWLVGLAVNTHLPEKAGWMNIMLLTINILAYTGFAAVFLSYGKMQAE
jgi:hypothetical protein